MTHEETWSFLKSCNQPQFFFLQHPKTLKYLLHLAIEETDLKCLPASCLPPLQWTFLSEKDWCFSVWLFIVCWQITQCHTHTCICISDRTGGERLLLYQAGQHPLSAGNSYRRKRSPPQFPRSILNMKSLRGELLGNLLTKTTYPGQARLWSLTWVIITTKGPGKECRTNELPPNGRIQGKSKGERRCQSICPTNYTESFLLESILAEWCMYFQKGL